MGLVGLLALGSGCGGEDTCFTEYNCGAGRRCELGPNFTEGVCVPCDPAEIPYDGLDNDCRPNTPDDDLDGDGDNSTSSRANPGTDCDDNDPEVSGNVAETRRGSDDSLCRDGKDNDCDKVVDELDCADLTRPQVGFLTPTNGLGLSGRYLVQVSASDRANETGVREVRLEVVGRGVLGTRMSPPYDFEIDTTQVPDGVIVLRATAVDGALREGAAEISVYVDNYSGPRISLTLPSVGERRGGVLPIVAEAVDAVGVFDFAVEDQGMTLSRAQGGVLDVDLDTRMLRWPDGPRTLTLVARDNNGAETRLALPLEIDNTPPTLTLAPMAGGAPLTGSVELVATAAGDDEIAWVDVAGRRTMGPATGRLEARVPFNTLTLPNGPWVVTATAADSTPVSRTDVGNRAVVSRAYTVYNAQNEPPSFTFVSPAAGVTTGGVQTVRVGVRRQAGITAMRININGRFAGQATITGRTLEQFVTFRHDFGLEPTPGIATVEAVVEADRTYQASIQFPLARFGVPTRRPQVGVIGQGRVAPPVDLDNDGLMDAVSFRDVFTTVSLRFGSAGGLLDGPRELYVDGMRVVADDIAFGDFNLDGLLDLVYVSGQSSAVLLQVDAKAGFWTSVGLGAPASDVAVIDLDRDNDLDVVMSSVPGDELLVYRNLGRGSFGLLEIPSGYPRTVHLAAQDLDGDSNRELILLGPPRSGAGTVVSVFATGPSPRRLSEWTSPFPATTDMAFLNIDAGSTVDMAFAIEDGDCRLAYALNDGRGGLSPPTFVPFESGRCAAVAALDVDGNRTNELVVSGLDGPSFGAWVVEPSSGSAPRRAPDHLSSTESWHTADMDGDGEVDLLASTRADGYVVFARRQNGRLPIAKSLFEGGRSLRTLQVLPLGPGRAFIAGIRTSTRAGEPGLLRIFDVSGDPEQVSLSIAGRDDWFGELVTGVTADGTALIAGDQLYEFDGVQLRWIRNLDSEPVRFFYSVFADVDGDLLTDQVVCGSYRDGSGSGLFVYRNVRATGAWELASGADDCRDLDIGSRLMVQDVDGDGSDEILQLKSGNVVSVSSLAPVGGRLVFRGQIAGMGRLRGFAYFDGPNRPQRAYGFATNLSGRGFGASAWSSASSSFGPAAPLPLTVVGDLPDESTFADTDGDGYSDLVMSSRVQCPGSALGLIGCGDPDGAFLTLARDVNGDGKADIVRRSTRGFSIDFSR
jgi:hypothetical protein